MVNFRSRTSVGSDDASVKGNLVNQSLGETVAQRCYIV